MRIKISNWFYKIDGRTYWFNTIGQAIRELEVSHKERFKSQADMVNFVDKRITEFNIEEVT